MIVIHNSETHRKFIQSNEFITRRVFFESGIKYAVLKKNEVNNG